MQTYAPLENEMIRVKNGAFVRLSDAEQQIASLKKQLEEKEKEIEGIVERVLHIIKPSFCPNQHQCVRGVNGCDACIEHWLRTGQVPKEGEGK